VDIRMGQPRDALMVPNDCVVRQQGHTFVYVKAGGSFRRQPVTAGAQNNLVTVIESGLKAGDVVRRGTSQG